MPHWSWWLGGLALAAVPVAHFVLLRRMMAVSGRFTAIVDRLRHGPEPQAPGIEAMSPEELARALREVTAQEFGEQALEEPQPAAGAAAPRAPAPAPGLPTHVLFFAGLLIGGFASAALAGSLEPTAGLQSSILENLVGSSPVVMAALLLGGGVLIGFGTRMAGGCTSGHGLCGVSRFQPGSLLATAAFFGTGVGVSFLLGALQ